MPISVLLLSIFKREIWAAIQFFSAKYIDNSSQSVHQRLSGESNCSDLPRLPRSANDYPKTRFTTRFRSAQKTFYERNWKIDTIKRSILIYHYEQTITKINIIKRKNQKLPCNARILEKMSICNLETRSFPISEKNIILLYSLNNVWYRSQEPKLCKRKIWINYTCHLMIQKCLITLMYSQVTEK